MPPGMEPFRASAFRGQAQSGSLRIQAQALQYCSTLLRRPLWILTERQEPRVDNVQPIGLGEALEHPLHPRANDAQQVKVAVTQQRLLAEHHVGPVEYGAFLGRIRLQEAAIGRTGNNRSSVLKQAVATHQKPESLGVTCYLQFRIQALEGTQRRGTTGNKGAGQCTRYLSQMRHRLEHFGKVDNAVGCH